MAAQHLRAQVRGELLTSDGRTLASVSRPCLLPHRSPVVRMFRRAACSSVPAHRHPGLLASSLMSWSPGGGWFVCFVKVAAGGRPVMRRCGGRTAQVGQFLLVLLFRATGSFLRCQCKP